MRSLYVTLAVFTVLIYAVSIVAATTVGYNWPATFVSDVLVLDWRAQFDVDLLLHLILLGVWAAWREGFGFKGWLFGVFCVVWGGMFSFPYLIYAGLAARGDARVMLLGVHARGGAAPA